jgi:mono/diheme cytochrome c family protein
MWLRNLIAGAVLVPLVGSVASAADGAAVYRSQCAACHGEAGKSETPVGKAMKIPALAGNVGVAAMSEADIAAAIKGAAKHPATTKGLPSSDLEAVAAHVKKLAVE